MGDKKMAEEEKEPESKDKDVKPEVRVPLSLPPGTIVKNRWKLTSKIGQGAFGETYAGYDLNSPDSQQVAIKVERWDNKKMVLKLEVMALKKLQLCPYVVKYVSSGRQDDFNFLVMERLGENLAELRKKTTCGAFSMGTTLRLGVQMLEAIEGCHNLSYIHRDIKPSNFVIGKSEAKRRRSFLIDFGLARKYRMPGGEIRPPRKSAGFRGTARYASIHSHQSKELSRRDDLWSLFYVLVEFASGSLPWRKIKDKDQIGELKEKYTNLDLVKDLPNGFALFMEHLQSLGYPTSPDYSYLRSLLQGILDAEGVVPETPYDWELSGSFTRSSIGGPPAADVTSALIKDKLTAPEVASDPHVEEHPASHAFSDVRRSQAKLSREPDVVEPHPKVDTDHHLPPQSIDLHAKSGDPDRPTGIALTMQPPQNTSLDHAETPRDSDGPAQHPQAAAKGPPGDRPSDPKPPPPAPPTPEGPGKPGKGPPGGKGTSKGCRCVVM